MIRHGTGVCAQDCGLILHLLSAVQVVHHSTRDVSDCWEQAGGELASPPKHKRGKIKCSAVSGATGQNARLKFQENEMDGTNVSCLFFSYDADVTITSVSLQ